MIKPKEKETKIIVNSIDVNERKRELSVVHSRVIKMHNKTCLFNRDYS